MVKRRKNNNNNQNKRNGAIKISPKMMLLSDSILKKEVRQGVFEPFTASARLDRRQLNKRSIRSSTFDKLGSSDVSKFESTQRRLGHLDKSWIKYGESRQDKHKTEMNLKPALQHVENDIDQPRKMTAKGRRATSRVDTWRPPQPSTEDDMVWKLFNNTFKMSFNSSVENRFHKYNDKTTVRPIKSSVAENINLRTHSPAKYMKPHVDRQQTLEDKNSHVVVNFTLRRTKTALKIANRKLEQKTNCSVVKTKRANTADSRRTTSKNNIFILHKITSDDSSTTNATAQASNNINQQATNQKNKIRCPDDTDLSNIHSRITYEEYIKSNILNASSTHKTPERSLEAYLKVRHNGLLYKAMETLNTDSSYNGESSRPHSSNTGSSYNGESSRPHSSNTGSSYNGESSRPHSSNTGSSYNGKSSRPHSSNTGSSYNDESSRPHSSNTGSSYDGKSSRPHSCNSGSSYNGKSSRNHSSNTGSSYDGKSSRPHSSNTGSSYNGESSGPHSSNTAVKTGVLSLESQHIETTNVDTVDGGYIVLADMKRYWKDQLSLSHKHLYERIVVHHVSNSDRNNSIDKVDNKQYQNSDMIHKAPISTFAHTHYKKMLNSANDKLLAGPWRYDSLSKRVVSPLIQKERRLKDGGPSGWHRTGKNTMYPTRKNIGDCSNPWTPLGVNVYVTPSSNTFSDCTAKNSQNQDHNDGLDTILPPINSKYIIPGAATILEANDDFIKYDTCINTMDSESIISNGENIATEEASKKRIKRTQNRQALKYLIKSDHTQQNASLIGDGIAPKREPVCEESQHTPIAAPPLLLDVTCESIHLGWVSPDTLNRPEVAKLIEIQLQIFGYSIQRNVINGYKITIPDSAPTWERHFSLSEHTTALIDGLLGETLYSARVRGRNAVGWGSWSSKTAIKTLSAAIPQRPSTPWVSAETTSTTAHIEWDAPSTPGSAIIDYEIKVIRSAPDRDFNKMRSAALIKLESYGGFKDITMKQAELIQVRCRVTAKEDVTSDSGDNNNNETTIPTVYDRFTTWIDARNILRDSYRKDYEMETGPIGFIESSRGAVATCLKSLLPSTYYIVAVRAKTKEGFSDWSEPVELYTQPSSVPLPPRSVKVVRKSSGSITVNWCPPQYDGSSIITRYRIQSSLNGFDWNHTTLIEVNTKMTKSSYKDKQQKQINLNLLTRNSTIKQKTKLKDNDKSTVKAKHFNPHQIFSGKLSALEHGKRYFIRVCAKNAFGWSKGSQIIDVYTLCSNLPPTLPQPQVVRVSQTRVWIKINSPLVLLSRMPYNNDSSISQAPILDYEIQISSLPHDWDDAMKMSVKNISIVNEIQYLKSESMYYIRSRARNIVGYGKWCKHRVTVKTLSLSVASEVLIWWQGPWLDQPQWWPGKIKNITKSNHRDIRREHKFGNFESKILYEVMSDEYPKETITVGEPNIRERVNTLERDLIKQFLETISYNVVIDYPIKVRKMKCRSRFKSHIHAPVDFRDSLIRRKETWEETLKKRPATNSVVRFIGM